MQQAKEVQAAGLRSGCRLCSLRCIVVVLRFFVDVPVAASAHLLLTLLVQSSFSQVVGAVGSTRELAFLSAAWDI